MSRVEKLLFGCAFVLFGVIVVAAVHSTYSEAKVSVFIDAENNIICYIRKDDMECFPYHDEGTHLEIVR